MWEARLWYIALSHGIGGHMHTLQELANPLQELKERIRDTWRHL